MNTQIGDTIYILDENRRVYRNDDGTPRRSPNPRCYFVPVVVTGETRQSWLAGGLKVDKHTLLTRDSRPRQVFLSAQSVEDWLWAKEHRYDIVRLVERCDVATLRQIAALVGYQK